MNEKLGYCPSSLYKGNPESPLGNLTADGLVWMAQKYCNVDADVSIYNSGGIRNSFNKGDITLEDVYAVYLSEENEGSITASTDGRVKYE